MSQIRNGSGNFTEPRTWTQDEIRLLLDHKSAGKSVEEIGLILGRTAISVQLKLKRLNKDFDKYNRKHRELKYITNQAFLDRIAPESLLDLYAGNSFYLNKVPKLITNDIDQDFPTTYNKDAYKLLAELFIAGYKFDVIDLDPFGSAYQCFDLATKMAKKGLIVSFGEWGHLRWKRLDFVRDRYQINDLADFDEQRFISEIQRIGRINKKQLILTDSLKYGNFLRTYFEIQPIKTTEQWEENATN